MKSKVNRGMLTFALAFMLFSVAGVFVMAELFDAQLAATATTVQALLTIAAIAIGGVYAFFKLEAFREFHPHLTITQHVKHRKIGDSYVHISIRAKLVNNSKVKIEILDASFWMQQIAPLLDSDVEMLYSGFRSKPNRDKYFDYPTLMQFEREWDNDEFVIEPGESASENYEFIVKDELNTVSVTAFFNDQTTGSTIDEQNGWAAISIYDLK